MNRVFSLLRPETHSVAAGCKAAFLAAAVLLAWLATPLRAGVINDFGGPK